MITRAPAFSLLLATLLATAGAARAEEPPASRQVLLLLRVLVYDRNLKSRGGDTLRVAVAFRADDRQSEERRAQLVAAFEEASHEVVAASLPVRVMAVPYRDPADLEARLAAARPAALYACPGLEAAADAIAKVTRRLRIVSASSSRQMTESGLAIGIVSRGARASIVVNLRAARSEGADLDAALLGLAEVL